MANDAAFSFVECILCEQMMLEIVACGEECEAKLRLRTILEGQVYRIEPIRFIRKQEPAKFPKRLM